LALFSGRLIVGAGSTQPFIDVTPANGQFILSAQEGTFLFSDAPGVPVIQVQNHTLLELFFFGPVLFNSGFVNCLGSDTLVLYPHDAAVPELDIPTCLVQDAMLDVANETQYADYVVPPPLVPVPLAIRGPNVQEALDGVKVRLPLTVVVTNTVLGANVVTWSRPINSYVVTMSFTRIGSGSTTQPSIVVGSKFPTSMTLTDFIGDNDLEVVILPTQD
jgi:hypothetical protein